MSTGERSRFFRASALLCSQAQGPKKSAGTKKKYRKKTKAPSAKKKARIWISPFSSLCPITVEARLQPKAAGQSCSDIPILTVMSLQSCIRVVSQQFWLGIPVLAVLSWQSCPGSPVLAVLSNQSSPSSLVLFWLSYPFGSALDVLS